MQTLDKYGQAIAATTIALQQFLASEPGMQATARPPDAARRGVSGPSVNLFLYRDDLARYREGGELNAPDHLLVELHYLVSAHPGDDADTDAASQRAYGAARSAIDRHPVVTVPDGAGGSFLVRLATDPLTLEDLTSLWDASTAALRLSFGLTASFALDLPGRAPFAGIRDVVDLEPGAIAVFAGPGAAAKQAAGASVAQQRGESLVSVPLSRLVSKYIGETEHNLETLFARAEDKKVVLFIDEADALFGQRTEVRDSHDRYARVDAEAVLELLSRAPGVVIIAVKGPVGSELDGRAAGQISFPD
jgi:hypothetical protein